MGELYFAPINLQQLIYNLQLVKRQLIKPDFLKEGTPLIAEGFYLYDDSFGQVSLKVSI